MPEIFWSHLQHFSCNTCISEAPRLSQSPGQLKTGPRAKILEKMFSSCPRRISGSGVHRVEALTFIKSTVSQVFNFLFHSLHLTNSSQQTSRLESCPWSPSTPALVICINIVRIRQLSTASLLSDHQHDVQLPTTRATDIFECRDFSNVK